MTQEAEDFIAHYGKKGMKWGKRSRSAKEIKITNTRKKALKSIRTLSDGDLKKFSERLTEEKKLKILIKEDLSPGRTVAKRIVSESGQRAAKTVATGAMVYGVKVALDKQFNAGEAAKYLSPRPKTK